MNGPARMLSRLSRARDGSTSIEFVMIMPLLLMMIMSSFELGMVTLRQVMLDRGVELAVRDIRLGNLVPVTHDSVSTAICGHALILPDCTRNLRLEMVPLDPRAWIAPPRTADCVDRADTTIPLRNFTAGIQNQLMLLRACSLFDPYFPTTGLGSALPRQSGGAYALLSASAFVIEP